MRELEKCFKSKGMNYTVLYRNTGKDGNDYVLCSVEDGSHFDVMRVMKKKESVLFGKVVEARETIPSSEQWGTYAFSHKSYRKAFEKYTYLCEKED
jgi:hypothetical protein